MYRERDSFLSRMLTPLLSLLSLPYKAVAWWRWRRRAGNPRVYPELFIVSVDNLAFGGTGKTSLVLEIAREWQERGVRFAVVLRGYKGAMERDGGVVTAAHTAAQAGDEACLLKSRFPMAEILVGRDRHASLRRAVEAGCRAAVLDDGFQSSDIVKDLSLMLVNPSQPFYYLRHFPALLRRCGRVYFYRAVPPRWRGVSAGTYDFVPGGFFDGSGREVSPGDDPLLAFCALGDNRRFHADMRRFRLADFVPFPDHHPFSAADLDDLEARRRRCGARYMVCTEKDFQRIPPALRAARPFLYVQNRIQLTPNPLSALGGKTETQNRVAT